MTPAPLPARLYVFLAREASIAVIFRRGPSEWVQMIKWHTGTDTFEAGQWLHGRIYPERCDLSPDGQLLVYFAGKFNQKTMSSNSFAWTAISKPPYFTALDIAFQGDTWGGGGIFSTSQQVWFYSRNDANWRIQNLPITSDNLSFAKPNPADAPYTYPERMRLHLGGWQEIDQAGSAYLPRLIWRKTLGNYVLTYTETAWSKNQAYAKHYKLKLGQGDTEITLGGVLWADFDQQGRLVLAREGKLYSATLQNSDLHLTELADFNANQFESIEAPAWAQKW